MASLLASKHDVLVQLTPDGDAMMSQENLPLYETIKQIAGYMTLHGGYTDVVDIQKAGHPVTVLKTPSKPGGPNGNSYVYSRDGGLVIKASMPGHDDIASFAGTQHLHNALSQHSTRVGAPAQLALLRSEQTGRTSIIMEKVPGDDLGAYTHYLAGNIPQAESNEAYRAGVRIVKRELVIAIGRIPTIRLNDLDVRKQGPNILTTGDPRQPETQLFVIDQQFRSLASTALAPLVSFGRRPRELNN